MPEYLAPGVYVEERPGLRTIEGVSTSTTGFVGMTERGPVEGLPILVTSFGEFQRQFGGYLNPREDGGDWHGYLPMAVRHFFDNGGKRAFIMRAYKAKGEDWRADRRQITLKTGVVARLRTTALKGSDHVYLTSLRGFIPGTSSLFSAPGAAAIALTNADPDTGRVELSTPLLSDVRTESAYAQLTESLGEGTSIIAREPGVWGEAVRILIRPVSGPRVALLSSPAAVEVETRCGPSEGERSRHGESERSRHGEGQRRRHGEGERHHHAEGQRRGASDGETRLLVASTAPFYVGATIAITDKAGKDTRYATVKQIVGNSLVIVTPGAGLPSLDDASVALAEVEILVSWKDTLERFRGSWWDMKEDGDPPLHLTPAQRDEFNATRSAWYALDHRSTLVALNSADPLHPSAAVTAYDPSDPLASHPTTELGAPANLGPAPKPAELGARANLGPAPKAGSPGQPDDPPTPLDYIGNPATPGKRTGIAALADEEDISLVAVPGIANVSVQAALVEHAETAKYRFAVLDGPRHADIAAIRAHRGNFDTSYAALYYPWVQVIDPFTGDRVDAPPSGIVLGVYARSDNERGVWKAPANEIARGAIDLVTPVSQGDQEILNPEGINALRDFRHQDRGIRIWGARTLSSDPQWRYVNVRRLFLYLERSIDRGTQWVVFEPNNDTLWEQIRRVVEMFLDTEWRRGALLGARAEDAFYVKCDRSTMSLDDIQNGRLICEIGVAPTRPAEFVIFRIGQLTADASPGS